VVVISPRGRHARLFKLAPIIREEMLAILRVAVMIR
jgi:hypothetical protein